MKKMLDQVYSYFLLEKTSIFSKISNLSKKIRIQKTIEFYNIRIRFSLNFIK